MDEDQLSGRHDFSAFVAQRSGTLLRLAILITGDRADAEDLLQTCLAKAYLAWPRLHRRESAEAYVRRALVTTNISLWRRRRRLPRDDRPADVMVPSGSGAVDDHVSLWPIVRSLPARQRCVIVLRYYEGLTESETADVMGCTIGTVKGYHARALARLRSQVTTDGLVPRGGSRP